MTNFACTRCDKVMSNYGEVGYDGPTDPSSTECTPFIDWMTLCSPCYEADTELQAAVAATAEGLAEPLFAEQVDELRDAESMYP